ncbi:MAG: MBL fold metallo-hydrolase [Pseudodesulfovibrio sp.]|nr:MBL fold metallo-hydrolase [Pseudodesulfovibrio sp.]
MQITFLVDNNSLIGSCFLAEPALSILIKDEDKRILFDAGYSDAFLINARRKGLDLLHLDWIVLSHGHFDHTWGLADLARHYFEAGLEKLSHSRPRLLAHPLAFVTKRKGALPEIGMLIAEDKLSHQFELALTNEPVWLSEKLVTLGEIERVLDFEQPAPLGERMDPDGPVDDNIVDDTAMAYVTDQGLVVISGCAHSGICNTVEQARRITGVDTVHTVLGGFHLQKAKPERLDPTTDYLAALNLKNLYACHCTDLAAKIALARKCPIKEVGSGLTLRF